MKRFISLFLCFALLLSCFSIGYISISRKSMQKNVADFTTAIQSLQSKYELDEKSFEYNYNQDNPNATENRLIIKTNDKISDANAVETVYGLDYAVLQYDNKGAMLEDYEALKNKGYTVSKDKYIYTYATESEIEAGKWAMDTIGTEYAKSEILNSNSHNSEIVVGVLDSGINYEHSIFTDRIIDTTFNMSTSGEENDCMDDNGHGTAVAGVIALNTPDNVKIKPYKIMDSNGSCTLSTFIAAVETIISSDDKPDIINMSLGGYDPLGDMDIETELVAELVECGVTVCVSSGNNNLPVEYIAPANCESAITVGAYNSNQHICSFSNYGDGIDIAAPGEKIYTASRNTDEYQLASGTSFACPYVSAACAYILMQNPNLSPDEVQNQLKSSAIDMGEDEEIYFGSGMLNFANLINDKTSDICIPSTNGGMYHTEQTISFDNIPNNTQLIYTLDKSTPSATNGNFYNEPISIDNEMQLNYALIQDGKYVSNISSQYYTIQYYADEDDFEINDDGTIISYNGDKINIVVPEIINGIIPSSVGRNAFKKCNLTSIVLPDSVKQLFDYSFYQSENLKHIVGKGVEEVCWETFAGCLNLRDEVMPKLSETTDYSFKNCKMLHNIDFGDSVEYLGWNTFENSGLTSADFPNLTNCDIESLFKNSTIMTCDISNNEILSSYSFWNCSYLYELDVQSAVEVGYNVIVNNYYLEELNLLSAVYIAESAFNYSYIDILYAPECEEVFDFDMACGLGEGSYIRVIDMPKLTQIHSRHLFDDMFVEEIYLDSIENLTDNAFINLPSLKVLYLPKAKGDFYYIAVDKYGDYPYSAPIEILWIPSVTEITGLFTLPDTMKLMYAPSLTKINVKSYNSTLILSEKATNVNISPTKESYDDNVYPTIITPKNSNAWNQWCYSNEDLNTYIDSDTFGERKGMTELVDDSFVYTLDDNGNTISIPVEIIKRSWKADCINEKISDDSFLFYLDVVNDSYINAKDFARIHNTF